MPLFPGADFEVSAPLKTTLDDSDCLLGVDSAEALFRITKANLLAALTSSRSGGMSDPYFSDVVLLTHFDSLVDVTGKTLTLGGDAQIISSDKKYGNGCLLLDGSGDYLALPNHVDFDFSTGLDFTIECYVKLASMSSGFKAITARSVVNSDSTFNLDINNATIRLTGWYTTYISVPHGMAVGNWYYIAVKREGNVLSLFIDAVLKGSFTGSTNFPNTNTFTFGGDPLSGAVATLDGKIDEVRITKRARTISQIPSIPFPNN
ncbi:LamG domain-containing protein [Nostoc sp.]|uniref:LamG domain-containing protein n=1 Tax=Nostoc sp. TaxID=1180 RepID=UPI002FF9545A